MPMQVWSDGETPLYLGEIPTWQIPDNYRDGDVMDLNFPGKTISLKVREFGASLIDEAGYTSKIEDLIRKHHIAAHHRVSRDLLTNQTVYRWKGACISFADYELLFDHDDFIPYDEVADPERKPWVAPEPLVYVGTATETLAPWASSLSRSSVISGKLDHPTAYQGTGIKPK